jgi:hypothetical protein
LQDGDLVARDKGRPEQLPHRPDESVVTHGVVRPDRTLDLLFRLKKIPDDQDRDRAAQ